MAPPASLGLSFARAVHRLRETFYLLGDQFTTQAVTQEEPGTRDAEGEVWGREVGLPSLLLSPNLHVLTDLQGPPLSS